MSERQGGGGTDDRRSFLGLEDPIRRAADLVLEAAVVAGGFADLTAVTVVVPGGRARRQLLRSLAVGCVERGLRLVPPSLILIHEVELTVCGGADAPIADDVTTRLAWVRALGAAADSDRCALLAPAADTGLAQELRVVSQLLDAHRQLEASCVSARDVADAAAGMGGDGARYLALERVAAAAGDVLAEVGLVDADAARRAAVERPDRSAAASGPLFVLAAVDLPVRASRALRGCGQRVRPLCIARPADADRFDDLGAVVPAAWVDRGPEVPLASIRVVDRPIDQAEATVERVVGLAAGGVVDPDRVAVVLADDGLGDVTAREFAGAGAPAHVGRGVPVAQLAPARALARFAAYLRDPGTTTLRALLGVPVIERVLLARAGREPDRESALAALDQWLEDHHARACGSVEPTWPELSAGQIRAGGRRAAGQHLLAQTERALRDLCATLPASARLGEAAEPLLRLLAELFADPSPPDDRGLTDAALVALRTHLAALSAMPGAIQPECRIEDAIDALLAIMATVRVPAEPRIDEVDLIGWLELPFDPAEAVVVVGMNDGCVPAASVDPWLPNALRRAVGLPDERQRVARDTWILSTALARRAAFVVGRRDHAGEPLAPSRLLLTGRGPALAERVLALTAEPPRHLPERGDSGQFGPPTPPRGPLGLDEIPVTAFARYLESPYHFWIERMMRLRAPEPAGEELDARGFGTVVHAVLEAFGRREDSRDLDDPERILGVLAGEFERVLAERAGPAPGPGLLIQRRIVEARLRWFAQRQAEEVRNGWRIHAVERSVTGVLDVRDRPVTLVGKVDRIDHHAESGRWRILDYKTSDKGKKPGSAHRAKDGSWRDLQLPLYHHLLADGLRAIADGEIGLGYFNVGASWSSVGVAPSDELVVAVPEALAEARRIVELIRAGELAPPARQPRFQSEALAILCRATALVDADADAEDDS